MRETNDAASKYLLNFSLIHDNFHASWQMKNRHTHGEANIMSHFSLNPSMLRLGLIAFFGLLEVLLHEFSTGCISAYLGFIL